MTKRALLVGCTGGGLVQEGKNDPQYSASVLSMTQAIAPYKFACHVVSADTITLEQWVNESLWLQGADVAVLFYSGHGFRARASGKIITGIWSGVPISHALFEQSVLAPTRKNTGVLVRIYDCCFGGSGVQTLLSAAGNVHRARIKSHPMCDDEAPANIEHYALVNEKDVVIAACGGRQFSYGYFDGGVSEYWHPLNTRGHSLFTWCLWPSLNYWAGNSLAKGVNTACQFRSNAAMEFFSAGAGWLMAPGVKYPKPDVILRKPRSVPDNILIAS